MATDEQIETEFEQLIHKNVDAIGRIEHATQAQRTRTDVLADGIAAFCGSMAFVWVHVVWFGGWLVWNSLPMVPRSVKPDPPPYPILTLVVSLEAIFLSTFILISQNRQQRTADHRNHLDLQINMLAEQESSQMLQMMRKTMEHLGVPVNEPKVQAMEKEIDPEVLAGKIEEGLVPPEPKK